MPPATQGSVNGRTAGLRRGSWCGLLRCCGGAWERNAKVDDGAMKAPSGLVSLGLQEGESQVDAFDLAAPSFRFGLSAAIDEVRFEFVESADHFRADLEHRAADVPLTELVWAPSQVNSL